MITFRDDVRHVTLDGEDLFCRHCGKREKVLPISISPKRLEALRLTGEAFTDEHERCVETDASPTRRAARDPIDWITGGDTGTSSATIWHVMTGRPFPTRFFRPSVPLDPSDFGRCHRLLELFPEWRARLPEVAAKYPEWAPLVSEWDRMTVLYERDLPTGKSRELYELMQQLRGEA